MLLSGHISVMISWSEIFAKKWRAAMQSYVGLDVSDKETSVCVMSDRGKILWQGKVLSDPQMLAEVIKRRAPSFRAISKRT